VKKFSVFISSTSEDLGPYRQAAKEGALATQALLPRMMEYFAASGHKPPLEECLAKVSETDVLVVIVAHRYGWVPPDQPDGGCKSITWLECEQAVADGKEVLAFLAGKKPPWPVELKESYRLTEAEENGTYTDELAAEVRRNRKKLEEFKQWLDDGRVRATFATPEELQRKVEGALREWINRQAGAPALPANPPADPATYLQHLREDKGWIDIRGLQVGTGKATRFRVERLYIALQTSAGKDPAQSKEAAAPVPLEQALQEPKLVVTGDPGSGKSTFLRRVASTLCRTLLGEDPEAAKRELGLDGKLLPVLIGVAELAQHIRKGTGIPDPKLPGWLPDYLGLLNEQYDWKLPKDWFLDRLRTGGCLVLLDGLDEARDRREREEMAALVENVTRAYPRCRFVVSTRPQSYTGKVVLHGFAHRHIAPLEREAIRTFLEKWSGALYPANPPGARKHCKELEAALASRREIRLMARTPVMLTALAVVHWNERRIPEQRAELYESIVTWLLRSREERPGRETVERSRAHLQHLALAMQNHPDGRQVQVSRRWAAETLAVRLGGIEQAERYLEDEEGDSGVIVSRGHELRFAHLTFQEYLTARAIAGTAEAVQFRLLVEGDTIYRAEWREVATLLAGVLHQQGADKVGGLVAALLDRLGRNPMLTAQARCVGLIGAMVRDLRPLGYEPADPRFARTLDSVLAIFDEEKSASVDFQVRLEAAEALGQAGDPRLRTPRDQDYWVAIPGEKFEIGRYPVTVEEYRRFIDYEGYQDARWWAEEGFGKFQQPEAWDEQQSHPNRPVAGVSWYEAAAYCAWADVRLPTEVEWERAARGEEGREYPWGKEKPDGTRANYYETGPKHATPVGLYPKGATPEGVQDMAGNVWEWVVDWYDDQKKERVLRGGSFFIYEGILRAAVRSNLEPVRRYNGIGFRCVRE
jgi:hypothetical protein